MGPSSGSDSDWDDDEVLVSSCLGGFSGEVRGRSEEYLLDFTVASIDLRDASWPSLRRFGTFAVSAFDTWCATGGGF